MVVAPSRFLQKAAKSCSPSSGSAAAFMASTSSSRGQSTTWPRASGSPGSAVAQPVDVAPLEGGEAGVEAWPAPRRGRGARCRRAAGCAGDGRGARRRWRRRGRREPPGRARGRRRRCGRHRSGERGTRAPGRSRAPPRPRPARCAGPAAPPTRGTGHRRRRGRGAGAWRHASARRCTTRTGPTTGRPDRDQRDVDAATSGCRRGVGTSVTNSRGASRTGEPRASSAGSAISSNTMPRDQPADDDLVLGEGVLEEVPAERAEQQDPHRQQQRRAP